MLAVLPSQDHEFVVGVGQYIIDEVRHTGEVYELALAFRDER